MFSLNKIISLLLVLSIAYQPLFACDEDEHGGDGVKVKNEDNHDANLQNQKKNKKKKDNRKKEKDTKPDSFIRGESPEREVILELD